METVSSGGDREEMLRVVVKLSMEGVREKPVRACLIFFYYLNIWVTKDLKRR